MASWRRWSDEYGNMIARRWQKELKLEHEASHLSPHEVTLNIAIGQWPGQPYVEPTIHGIFFILKQLFCRYMLAYRQYEGVNSICGASVAG